LAITHVLEKEKCFPSNKLFKTRDALN